MNVGFIDFLTELGTRLSSGQLLTLLVAQQYEKQHCYLADIAGAIGSSDVTARKYLRSLQRQGHLVFVVHNTGGNHPNYEILWTRRSADEKSPNAYNLTRRAREIVVSHPDHGRKTIQHGNIRKFVRQHKLKYRAFRAVLTGERNHHHGWRLAS